MKVSERVKELQGLLRLPGITSPVRVSIQTTVTQLEAEIVEALRIARQEGYRAGYVASKQRLIGG